MVEGRRGRDGRRVGMEVQDKKVERWMERGGEGRDGMKVY